MTQTYETRRLKHYDPEDACVVMASDDQIPPQAIFEAGGRAWYSLTGSVGYTVEFHPGIAVSAGMVHDPEFPLPNNAITAIPLEKAVFGEGQRVSDFREAR